MNPVPVIIQVDGESYRGIIIITVGMLTQPSTFIPTCTVYYQRPNTEQDYQCCGCK